MSQAPPMCLHNLRVTDMDVLLCRHLEFGESFEHCAVREVRHQCQALHCMRVPTAERMHLHATPPICRGSRLRRSNISLSSNFHIILQVLEETGMHISEVKFLHVSNCVHAAANKHYVTIIMSATVLEVRPNLGRQADFWR